MSKVFFILFLIVSIKIQAQVNKEIMYVGTYSVRGSQGIYVLEFDPKALTLNIVQTVAGHESPTYLEIHPSGKFLYAANRGSVDGVSKTEGSVSAYHIEPKTGKIRLINSVPSFGLGSCHIGINPDGNSLIVSQFAQGTLGVYSLSKDGSLTIMTDSIRYTGHGTNVPLQQSPHIHSANFLPGNQFVIVADLGTDKLYSYRSKTDNGKLVPANPPFVATKPGSGPRHISFHPDGKHFYMAEELTSSVAVIEFDRKSGAMKIIEDQVASLPADFNETNSGADIHTSPDGKFLYMSNRGYNALAIFKIAKDGKVKLIGQQDTLGKIPRYFNFNKSGDYLFVTNQDSDNVVVFKVDKKTGLLSNTGIDLKIPSPVCIK